MSDDELRDAGAAGWLSKADDALRVAQVILSGESGVDWTARLAAEGALTGVADYSNHVMRPTRAHMVPTIAEQRT